MVIMTIKRTPNPLYSYLLTNTTNMKVLVLPRQLKLLGCTENELGI
jgi:hypothetical protein